MPIAEEQLREMERHVPHGCVGCPDVAALIAEVRALQHAARSVLRAADGLERFGFSLDGLRLLVESRNGG